MSYDQKYTSIDGTWHAIGWSEHTVCGIVIPHGNGYVTDLPDKKKPHCGPDTKTSETTKDTDPVENKAVADEAQGVEPPALPLASDAPQSAVKASKPATKETKKT